MASIINCLKWIFIFFNTLFTMTSVGIVVLVNVLGIMIMRDEFWLWWPASLFLGLIAGISFVGAYGAYKEKRWALILFSSLVSIGMVICLFGAVLFITSKDVITSTLAQVLIGVAMSIFNFQQLQVQLNLECCGISNGYQDWGSEIESCICPEAYWGTPKCLAVSSNESTISQFSETYTEVYSEPCLDFMMWFFNVVMDVPAGILFGWAIVAFIGVIMAIILTCKKRMTAMPVPTYECSMPPEYQELYKMKSMPEYM